MRCLSLELPDGKKIEADLILWFQRKSFRGPDLPTQIIFGEAKSFGRDAFKAIDIARMKDLAKLYPGSVLVFSTMKNAEDLSKDEIRGIRKFAEWGRK